MVNLILKALQIAAMNGNIKAVKFLLSKDFDPLKLNNFVKIILTQKENALDVAKKSEEEITARIINKKIKRDKEIQNNFFIKYLIAHKNKRYIDISFYSILTCLSICLMISSNIYINCAILSVILLIGYLYYRYFIFFIGKTKTTQSNKYFCEGIAIPFFLLSITRYFVGFLILIQAGIIPRL